MVHFGEFLKTWSLRSNSVTRQVNFNRSKISGKCQNSKTEFWSQIFSFATSTHFNGKYIVSITLKVTHYIFLLHWTEINDYNHLQSR